MNSGKEIILTDNQLQKQLKKWQKRLGLRDWEIKAGIFRMRDLSLENSQATCHWCLQRKTAEIQMLDPIDWPDTYETGDMEISLVHELLHLHFSPFYRDKFYMPIEQAIEAIAKSLCQLDRK